MKLHEAVAQNDLIEIINLLDNGADINQGLPKEYDGEGNTPLHLAAMHGSLAVTTLLIKRGAKIDSLNKLDATPLICACHMPAARTDNIFCLIAAGANINWHTAKLGGHTPLSAAIDSSNNGISDFLRHIGANT